MKFVIALILSLLSGSASAQGMGGMFPGPGTPHTVAAAYVGPGDVFTTSPYAAYSCSRVFTAAQASTSTSLCDLNAITGGAAVCTIRGSASGYADQSAYCPGSLTPAAACAAASGGSCNISQAYDLTGNLRDVVQATNANRPGITFSSTPTGTLPAIDCTVGTNPVLATTATFTQAQPLALSAVYIRTTGTALGGAVGANANVIVGAGTGANLAVAASGGAGFTVAATDNTWHAINALLNGTGVSSAINLDGVDTTGSSGGTTGFVTNNIRLCRAAASPLAGRIAEAFIWSAATNATDRGNVNTNQHSAVNGYNF